MSAPVTIQPAGTDTQINEAAKTTNYGTSATLWLLNTTNSRSRILLKFDFSVVVPVGATITSAVLSLYDYSAVFNGFTNTAYRLLRTDWVESEATWNEYKTGSNWSTAGALNTSTDITATDSADATSVSSTNWQNFTVTAQVQTAKDSVSGVAHFLVMVGGASDSDSEQNFRSSNYTTNTSLRPKLYIEYIVSSPSTSVSLSTSSSVSPSSSPSASLSSSISLSPSSSSSSSKSASLSNSPSASPSPSSSVSKSVSASPSPSSSPSGSPSVGSSVSLSLSSSVSASQSPSSSISTSSSVSPSLSDSPSSSPSASQSTSASISLSPSISLSSSISLSPSPSPSPAWRNETKNVSSWTNQSITSI